MAASPIKWSKLIVAIAICQLAGIIGSIFTVSAIPTWYATIAKPDWNPPSWIFGPVWTILYTLMGISLYRVWMKGLGKPIVRDAVFWFGTQLFFNAIWSIIFFRQHNLAGALGEILVLLTLLIIVIKKFYRIDQLASYLLIPYLAWVSFASYLTYTIWILNS